MPPPPPTHTHTGGVAGGEPVPMNTLQYHHAGPQENVYEAPQSEVVYEAPPDREVVYEDPPNGAGHDEVPPDATYEQIS